MTGEARLHAYMPLCLSPCLEALGYSTVPVLLCDLPLCSLILPHLGDLPLSLWVRLPREVVLHCWRWRLNSHALPMNLLYILIHAEEKHGEGRFKSIPRISNSLQTVYTVIPAHVH